MKKRTLTAIAIAAILIVAGVALAAVAFEMGGGARQLLAESNLAFAPNYDRNDRNDSNIGSWPGDGKTTADVDKIVVNWLSGSVMIEGADVDEVSFSESADRAIDHEERLTYRIDKDTLYIEYCRESNTSGIFGSGFQLPSKELVITVPVSLAGVSVETVSADVELSGLDIVGCIDLETTSGDLNVRAVSAGSVELNSVSGDVFFSGNTSEFDSDNTSGRTQAEFERLPKELDVDTVSGEVSLRLPANSNFELEFDTVSGNLDCGFEVLMYDGEYVAGNGGAEISISTVSGNCSVKKK